MNDYSCRPSDHQSDHHSDAGMHTLMCSAILISGICSDEYCIVYDKNRRPSRGNCLIWDVLIPQVSVQFLGALGAQVWGSGHFTLSSLDSVLSSSENGARHLLGPLLEMVALSWRTIRSVLHFVFTILLAFKCY